MDVIYEVRTAKPFDEAVTGLKTSLKNRGFGVLWELDFSEKLAEHGLEFEGRFKIFEVCNPQQARDVLSKNIQVGYFLPCKLVVYEKASTPYLGMLRPLELIKMMGQDELAQTADDVQGTLMAAIDEAA